MFIFIWAPCHARLSLQRVIKMTATNCKCLLKCSLASLGQSVEMEGHVCPSCLYVFFLYFLKHFFSISRYWEHVCEFKGSGRECVRMFLNQGSGFYLYQLFIEPLSWGLDGKVPAQFIWAARGTPLFSHSVAVCQLFTISFQSVYNRNTQANLCQCVEFARNDHILLSAEASTQLQFTE